MSVIFAESSIEGLILKDLREKKEQQNREALLNAVAKSRHSYEEIMTFIQSDPEDPDLQ